MKIILSPSATFRDDQPPVVSGEALFYRGAYYDFSQLSDGSEIKAELPFIGKISRVNGRVELTLEYQYNTETAEDNLSADWSDYTFVVTSGECPCPIVRKPVQKIFVEAECGLENNN